MTISETQNTPVFTTPPDIRQTLVVNLYAGSGAGKFACAMLIAAELKKLGIAAEYVPGYAKELVYDNSELLDGGFDNQMSILQEQNRRMNRLIGKVDVVVTDSPILQGIMYVEEKQAQYAQAAAELYNGYNNFNLFVNRGTIFEKSEAIDCAIKVFLEKNNIYYGTFQHHSINVIVNNIQTSLAKLERIAAARETAPLLTESAETTSGDFAISDIFITEQESLNAKGIMTQEQFFDMLKERDVTGEMTITQAAEMYKQYRTDNTSLAPAESNPDKFYVDKHSREVTLIYYNADCYAGGQYVINQNNFEQIRQAAADTANAEDFFYKLSENCKQHIVDITDPNFPEIDERYRNDPFSVEGSSEETMNYLINAANGAERNEVRAEVEAQPLNPDPTITVFDMNIYGYTSDGMLPLSNLRATELFDSGVTIYLLYPNNTEEMVLDADEIKVHNGLFGIERGDWEITPEYKAQIETAKPTADSREADLLFGDTNKFGIYQIRRDIDAARDYSFAPMRELEAHGLTVDRANYELVYTGYLSILDTQTNLHKIFNDFNINQPSDFTGHSVSVSDVIVLQWRGQISSHYVDSARFAELPAFTGNETQPQAQTNETLSLLGTSSEEVNAGGNVKLSVLTKAKMPLLTQLEANKRKVARQTTSALHKTNTPEVS
jgi:hypothetical protein